MFAFAHAADHANGDGRVRSRLQHAFAERIGQPQRAAQDQRAQRGAMRLPRLAGQVVDGVTACHRAVKLSRITAISAGLHKATNKSIFHNQF